MWSQSMSPGLICEAAVLPRQLAADQCVDGASWLWDGVRFTTCAPGDDGWLLSASSIRFDENTGRGSATHAMLRFQQVPIFYLPWFQFPIDGLHNLIQKVPPVVPTPHFESAVYTLNLLSATGTGILLAAVLGALVMGYRPVAIVQCFGRTLWLVRYSLLTIVLMLGLGTLTRFSGTDTTLGLAFANTGWFYPFFGTLMGWSLLHRLSRGFAAAGEADRLAGRDVEIA